MPRTGGGGSDRGFSNAPSIPCAPPSCRPPDSLSFLFLSADIIRQPSEEEIIKLAPPPKKA